MKKIWIVITLWCLVILGVVVASLMPHMAPPQQYHLDKLVHGMVYALLACGPAYVLRSRRHVVMVAVLLIGIGIGVELAQTQVVGRSGTIGDALADGMGALAGIAVGWQARKRT